MYKNIEWHGYEGLEFEFEGLSACVIKPNCKPNKKWALKTEYFDAFPETEIELLERGWHIAFNTNENRYAENYDLNRKSRFLDFVSKNFSLYEKCALIGMSCGGLYAVKLAAMRPEKISAIWLDAPVLNLLSFPCKFGIGQVDCYDEYYGFTGRTKSEMLSYREHPIDKMHVLLKNDIPILLIAGDSDTVVPYEENGKLLEDYYTSNGGKIKVIIKQGAGHHPHGLEDPKEVADIIESFCK